MSGAGSVHTVNGRIHASFLRNPAGAMSFKTVNGAIVASYPQDLAADVRLKTFHGAAYTDFEASALPVKLETAADRSGGTLRYRAERAALLRIGAGAPSTATKRSMARSEF